MPVDWSLYKSDITRLYVEENRTAEDTLKLLNSKHGTRITLRQFKFKFGGLKKLKADEWRVICHEVAKRKAQGISSDVYLHGRRQDPERLERAFRLYSSNASENALLSTDLGIDTVDQHRIEIRSSPTQGLTRLVEDNSRDVDFIMDISEGISSNDVESMETTNENLLGFDIENLAVDLTTPRLHTPSLPLFLSSVCSHDSVMIGEPTTNLPLPVRHDEATAWGDHGRVRFDSQQVVSSATRILSPIPDFNLSSSLGLFDFVNFPKPSYNLFWDSPAVSSVLESLGHDTRTSPELQVHVRHLNRAHGMVPWKTRGWLSSYLIGVHPRLQLLQPMVNLIDEFLIRTQNREEDEVEEVQVQFEPNNPKMLRLFFLIITYLASNNYLGRGILHNLIELVISNGHTNDFSESLKVTIPYEKAPIQVILESMCGWQYYRLGRKESLFERYPSEVLHLLSVARRQDLAGSLGWNLLRTVVASGHLEATKLLVERGVSLNQVSRNSMIMQRPEEPESLLALAAVHGSGDMLKFLISAGADVNHILLSRGSGVAVTRALRRASTHPLGNHSLEDIHEATALEVAVLAGHGHAVQLLLEAKAEVDLTLNIDESQNILEYSRRRHPDIHTLLLQHLILDEDSKTTLMVQAARKGIRPLADFLVKNDMMDDEFLERGLYHAIERADLEALGTFLRRGVDANTRKYRRSKHDSGVDLPHPLVMVFEMAPKDAPGNASDMVCLLTRSGARLNLEDAQAFTQYAGKYLDGKNHWSIDRIKLCHFLISLAQTGHDMSILGPTALELAAERSSSPIHECSIVLDAECAINSYGTEGMSALQAAAGKGRLALVQYLVHQGADVNFPARAAKGRTALQAAVERGHHEVVDYLLQTEADINAPPAENEGVTVLEAAARALNWPPPKRRGWEAAEFKGKSMTTFKKLLALGAPVNRTNGDSGGLLHPAIISSNTECLELALQKGAAVETAVPIEHISIRVFSADDGIHFTPLQLAAYLLNLEAVRLLIDHGACVNASASDQGFTALQAAASEWLSLDAEKIRENELEVFYLLFQHNADVNAPPSCDGGRTVLQAACSQEHPDIDLIQLLLSKGADANAPAAPIRGVTALQAASISGNVQLVKLLLEHRADINGSPALGKGRTAVEGAAEHGRSDIVRLLLNEGAWPDLATGFSRAVELAREEEHWHIVDLLEDHQRNCGLQTGMDAQGQLLPTIDESIGLS